MEPIHLVFLVKATMTKTNQTSFERVGIWIRVFKVYVHTVLSLIVAPRAKTNF